MPESLRTQHFILRRIFFDFVIHAGSKFNPQNALPAPESFQEKFLNLGMTFWDQPKAASVPEAPIFMDLSDVKPAGLDHLQMNENWTPFYQAFPLKPYGHYWHLDHSLPSSSTTPSGPSSSPEAQQETSTPGSTNGIQNPEASSSRTINGVQNPAHPEAATSRIKIPEVSKGPSAGEALGMTGYMKHKATSRRSFIPKSGTWKPWQRPRFKSGCRGMKFLRLENYHSNGFKSTQCFMNTICNMMYSCSEFRELFLKYGDHSPTANKIAEIFKGDRVSATASSKRASKTLSPPRGKSQLHAKVNLVLEVPLAGPQLHSVSCVQNTCKACHEISREHEIHQFKSGCRGMQFLPLENYYSKGIKSTQCFMNTVCNMMFSCSEFRALFLEYGDHSSTAKKIADIFKGDRVSAREWRWTLPEKYRIGQHDTKLINSLRV
ncbi:hypothetical protein B9Z55_027953 [Caenorhabditis nigoni]|uniref:Uncharacterized protein n=1 Tax=Caenorhabditis nigoni TaxID=1611254 RepID=A0A2G5SDB2_9PELO|nr:hypothetical protein B9Z55_027953 [Caenorhabditis nigoni]